MQLIKLRTYLRLYCLSFVNLPLAVEIHGFHRFHFQSKFSCTCTTLSSHTIASLALLSFLGSLLLGKQLSKLLDLS